MGWFSQHGLTPAASLPALPGLGGGQSPAPGMVVPGNIDLANRPIARNSDGSISTVRSISITDDQGNTILIPTVIGGRVVPNAQAIANWQATGQHLGIFKSEDAANNYAETLHEQQAARYDEQQRAALRQAVAAASAHVAGSVRR